MRWHFNGWLAFPNRDGSLLFSLDWMVCICCILHEGYSVLTVLKNICTKSCDELWNEPRTHWNDSFSWLSWNKSLLLLNLKENTCYLRYDVLHVMMSSVFGDPRSSWLHLANGALSLFLLGFFFTELLKFRRQKI